MKSRNLIDSFKNAFRGLKITYLRERNFRIQISFAILAIYFSIKFNIEKIYFIFVLLAIFLVLYSELINSALEILCDKLEKKYDENIKNIKDAIAGGVLLFSIFSIILGLIIFFRYIKKLDLFSIIFSVIIIIIPFLIKNKNDIIKKRGDV
ncbi:MAG: diacylglycerol kinase family protein [Caldisericia bacterium]|nr:diacylglycerol kinase family protein [Caldisericia bacterium]